MKNWRNIGFESWSELLVNSNLCQGKSGSLNRVIFWNLMKNGDLTGEVKTQNEEWIVIPVLELVGNDEI
jgi:hypothetical protein